MSADPCPDTTHVLEHSLAKARVQSPIISSLHETVPEPSSDSLRAPSPSDSGFAKHSPSAVPLSTSFHPPADMSLNVAMPSPAQAERIAGQETDEYKAAHTGSYHPHLDSSLIKRQTQKEEGYISPAEFAQIHPPPISSSSLNPADLIPQSEWNLAHQGSSHPHLQHINNQHLTR